MPDLGALLSPQSVAVVGASPDTSIIRGRTLKVMLHHRYPGRVYPVSRSHAEVQGLRAYASVAAIPERVDLAVLTIPAATVADELERCGKAGVKAAMIVASGFAEDKADAGAAMQKRIGEIARRYDMAVCGPNAEGFASMQARLCPTFSPAIETLDIPLIPERGGGRVAVVSQSGGIGFSFFDRGRPREIPFSHVVTTGNEAALECFDVVDYLLDAGSAEIFVLFLEAIRNADTFHRAAAKALQAGKPIIVAKIGRSEAGRRAAASHTAALAGEHEVYRAMFRRYGIIEGADIEEMVDIAACFSAYRERLPAGKRVGIVTASGGAGGWIADACVAAGLEVPELDAETRSRIDVHIPSYGTSQNPVDCTAQAVRQLGYSKLASMVGESERVDSVIVVVSARSAEVYERERASLVWVGRETPKPIVMWSYTMPGPGPAKILSEAGFPLIASMHNCARAVAAMAGYRVARERGMNPDVVAPARDEDRLKKTRSVLEAAGPVLCEYEAAPLLAQYGITMAPASLASSVEDAIAAAQRFEGPVALKVQSPDILHKNHAGAVALNVSGAESVVDAYKAVLASARKHHPDADLRGVLVQRMAPPGIEMIIGAKRDPTFGPMLIVGFGGTQAEILRDTALAPAPVSAAEARELLKALRAKVLLEGADVDGLASVMNALSKFASEHSDRIAEIDLNPVIVHPQGKGVSVVDALIVKRQDSL
ncbi:MAG TPA: acetate--CoA ligase family protein [Burkholderiales bacterium]|nr:acetate--CoA ligase family protein [Burkholderiales bacterium]